MTRTNTRNPINASPFLLQAKRVTAPAALFFLLFILAFSQTAKGQTIAITGHIYDDSDGGNISTNHPISTVSGNQLYVYLVDNSNMIVDRAVVSASGAYSLTATANFNYDVSLSATNYAVNATNPTLGLPTTFVNTAEGTTSLGDGFADGSVAINSSTDLVIDFAVDARPIGYSYNITSPTYDTNRQVIIPAAAFTALDPEDGAYPTGLNGRGVDLFQGINGTLYYNGSAIMFSSANAVTRINSFDVSLLRFKVGTGTAGMPHRFAFSAIDNGGVPEYVPNNITISNVLPIKLLSFSGKPDGNAVNLAWSTATEISNAGFDIERSTDARNFERVGSLASKAERGNSSLTLNYTFTDADAAPGVSYYRLKQTDLDGSFTYSNTIRISRSGAAGTFLVSAAPNPVSTTLSLDVSSGSSASEPVFITLQNAGGASVLSRILTLNAGRITTALDLSALPAGAYFMKVQTASGNIFTQRVMVLPR